MCSCAENCPESKHCMVVFIYETGECWVWCDKDIVVAASPTNKEFIKLKLDLEVDVEIKAVPLARVAEILSGRFQSNLLVPASRLHEPIHLVEKKTVLKSVVQKIGLVAHDVAA